MAPLYNYTTVLRAGELDIKSARLKAGMTQKEFNDLMNDPNRYHIEDPVENQSHRHEDKTKPANKTPCTKIK